MSSQLNILGPDVIIPQIQKLNKYLGHDDVINIQYTPFTLDYEKSSLTNPLQSMDHKSFNTLFNTEIELMSKIEHMLEQGQYFIHLLYTFRSVSRAIPIVVNTHYCYGIYAFYMLLCLDCEYSS